MDKDLKKAMNLLKQEIKYTKTSESDLLTGIIARFEELEAVVKKCSIPVVSGCFTETDVERAYNDGYQTEGEVTFDINNYR